MKVLIKPQVDEEKDDSNAEEESEAVALCDLWACQPVSCNLWECNPVSGDSSDGDILF